MELHQDLVNLFGRDGNVGSEGVEVDLSAYPDNGGPPPSHLVQAKGYPRAEPHRRAMQSCSTTSDRGPTPTKMGSST